MSLNSNPNPYTIIRCFHFAQQEKQLLSIQRAGIGEDCSTGDLSFIMTMPLLFADAWSGFNDPCHTTGFHIGDFHEHGYADDTLIIVDFSLRQNALIYLDLNLNEPFKIWQHHQHSQFKNTKVQGRTPLQGVFQKIHVLFEHSQ